MLGWRDLPPRGCVWSGLRLSKEMRVEGGRCKAHTVERWSSEGEQMGVDGVGGWVGDWLQWR